MIDSHCHLEQKDYEGEREAVIKKCKEQGLKAIITNCAHPKDFELTMKIAEENKGFVFPCIGLHPEYIKELSENVKDELIEKIKRNKEKIAGIGEVGLDYCWVKEAEWREKQKQLLLQFLDLANQLKKPVVIHSRESDEDMLKILDNAKTKIYWHLFGDKKLINIANERGFFIGIGPLVLRSKGIRKIAKDFPLDKILLETDSPWFGVPEDGKEQMFKIKGYPWNIKYVARQIAKEKKISFEEVWQTCGKNAAGFFGITGNLV